MRLSIGSISMLILPGLVSATFGQNFDHTIFDGILQKYVSDGMVNYQELKKDPSALSIYLEKLEQVDPKAFQQWPKAKQMAFWINAYNAITIEGILRHYPIQWGGLITRARFPQNSIRQIGGFWDKVFVRVMGRDVTLNDIEHKILRQEFNDPRIHFVVVCASIGCPVLESRAFDVLDLEQRLDHATRDFINNLDKVRLDENKNVLYLSSIFDWYKKDFVASPLGLKQFAQYNQDEIGIMEFVVRYFPKAKQNYIQQNQPKIRYLDYDWSLNKVHRQYKSGWAEVN